VTFVEDRSGTARSGSKRLAVFLPLVAISLLLFRSGRLLVKADSLPARADGAVVLQGSIPGENVRVHGAIELLQQGRVSAVMLSLPRESYWGEPIAPVALRYIEKKYGKDLSSHILFCETPPQVNSTRQEAEAISPCIRDQRWKDFVVVTSDYHTRRAGMIWRTVTAARNPEVTVYIHAVDDPEFQQSWWQSRLSAKTWFMEFSKLVWAETMGRYER
jgi:uncharacterized SAM-binding protein YcdF (DUF218 family)